MTRWILWGLSLVLTQGFGTLTSRARNTPSYKFHGVCAGLNHCTWFIAQVFLVDAAVKHFGDWTEFLTAVTFYTAVSTSASIGAHYLSINYFEKGNRRIGVYER